MSTQKLLRFALAAAVVSAPAYLAPTLAQTQRAETPKTERRICRSSTETGSLVKQRRRCYTRAEWERLTEGARKTTEQLQGNMPGSGDLGGP